jgi:hypothetical protein
MTALTAASFDWPGSAAQTARRVIEWAASPAGSPPHGSLNAVRALPGDAATQRALRNLARATAARLGAGQPALGDESAIGTGALFLAAAIGGRSQPELSARLAALVAPPVLDRVVSAGWADAIARHAVLAPALAGAVRTGPASGPVLAGPAAGSALAKPLRESLLRASPLSAVLFRPAEGQHDQAFDVALGMLARRHGTAVLATVLSGWHAEAEVLTWRAKLLYDMAAAHPAEVIEVYAAARLCHGADWDRRIAAAAGALTAAAGAEPDLLPVATIQYWAPLLVRQVSQRLRRRHLLGGYETALELVRDYGLETVGAL